MFPGESDDESEDSEANDSENEGENSEEEEDDKSRAGYLSASINSSDLESVDSESDSESFKDIIWMLNTQFKLRINRLIKHLKKKVEETNDDESEFDELFSVEARPKHNHNAKVEKSIKSIKQEWGENAKKRDLKAKQKEKFEIETQNDNLECRLSKRFRKEKLSSVLGSYFYNNLRQGMSESSHSPKS